MYALNNDKHMYERCSYVQLTWLYILAFRRPPSLRKAVRINTRKATVDRRRFNLLYLQVYIFVTSPVLTYVANAPPVACLPSTLHYASLSLLPQPLRLPPGGNYS